MPRARAVMPAVHARRRLRRAVGALAALVVIGSTLVVASAAPPAAALTGHVTGTVFRDYNGNGTYNTAAVAGVSEVGVAGVRVTAVNGAGTAIATMLTSSNGTYQLPIPGAYPDGTAVRIEFTELPAGYTDSFRGTSGTAGAVNSRTSVQFVTVGAENVDLALHKTTDLAKGTATPLITVIQAVGPYTGASSTAMALTAITRANATHTGSTAPTTLATFGQIGATWGLAVEPRPRTSSTANEQYYLYASAVLKRHSGFGPQGIAGLYRIPVTVNPTTGATSLDGTIVGYNLSGTGRPSYGTFTRTAADLTTPIIGGTDPNAFAAVGRQSIGGIAYADGTVYAVNLLDKKIYGYAVSTLASTTAPTEIDPGLAAADRPWALAIHQGRMYLGVTNQDGTSSRVMSRAITGGAWTTELTIPLGYQRGVAWSTAAPATGQTQAQWHAWDDNPSTLWPNSRLPGAWPGSWQLAAWGQPILSGITFDDGGNMVLGVADRFNFQVGTQDAWPNNSCPATVGGTSPTSCAADMVGTPVGETLYAGRNASGVFTLENGASGPTTTGGTPPNLVEVTTPSNELVWRAPGGIATTGEQWTRRNVQRGGREFFEDSVRWDGAGGIDGQGVVHDETTVGAVTVIPGLAEVSSTSYDAELSYNNAGNRFMSLTNGSSVTGFDQYAGGNPYFGKAAGLGGISALLTDAPVEIGNRVWYDADADGIQDADEAAINGAPVQLWTADSSGNPVTQLSATTTATVNGQAGTYFFRTEDAPTGSGRVAGFVKDANYVVVFPASTGSPTLVWPGTAPTGFTGLTWAQMALTTQTAGTNALIDSNPAVATGRAPVTVGSMGENDHSIDAGWVGLSTYRIQKSVVGTPPPGASFTINVASATNFRGENVLGSGGPDTRPVVDTIGYTLTAGQTLTTTEQVPYGTVLTFTESNMPGAAVAFSPNTGVGDDTGRLVIAPTSTAGGQLVTATNSFTSLALTKALSHPVDLPADTSFPIEYTINAGAVQTAEVEAGETLTIAGVPWGSTVELREPLVGPFSWGGWIWRTGTWVQGVTPLTPDVDGWVTVMAPSSTTALALTLTNHPIDPPALPFTGGLASDAFAIGGAIVLGLALALGGWQLVRRMRPRRAALHRL